MRILKNIVKSDNMQYNNSGLTRMIIVRIIILSYLLRRPVSLLIIKVLQEELHMQKLMTPVLTALLALVFVYFGLYAAGKLGADKLSHVNHKEYALGGFTYSGGLKNGLFSDYGAINFNTGDSYSGGFTKGRFEGNAIFNISAGTYKNVHFNGVFHEGQISSGTFYLNNGLAVIYEHDAAASMLNGQTWQYSGDFNERGQNGTGWFAFEDGSVYTGVFLNGLADGNGMLADADGNTIYEGSFRDGLFDGQGIYYSPEGWSYEGSFRAGLFDGEGQVLVDSSTIRGIWERGVQTTRYE